MAKRTISSEFKISGEDKYKQAVSDINSGLRVMNSEMKKTTAEYQSNAKSVEALKAKNDVLERTLSSQKEKVETLREAVKWAVGEFGEAGEKTMQWKTSLNLAEAELAKTQNKIELNNKAMEDADKGIMNLFTDTKGLGEVLEGVAGKFGISIPSGVKDSLDSFASFSVAGVTAVTAVVKAVQGLIDIEKKLVDITANSAEKAGSIRDTSQKLGISVEEVQELQYASELIGTSFETVQGANTKLIKSMNSAKEGTKSTTEAFEKLGVEVENSDGSLRNSTDVFYDVINALGKVQNTTERDALAMDVLGKSAMELNPLIVQGSEAFQEFRDYANEAGLVLSDDMVSALEAVDDAHVNLQYQQEATRDQMANKLAPAVETLYTNWTKFIEDTGKMLIESGILDTLGDILKIVANMIPLFESIIKTTIPDLGGGIDGIADKVDWFNMKLANLLDLLNTINPLNTFTNLARVFNGGTYASTQYTEAYKSSRYVTGNVQSENGLYTGNLVGGGELAGYDGKYEFRNASGSYNFRGGYTWVGESGAELVKLPSGSQIYNSQDSRNIGGNTFYVTIDAKNVKEFNDIVNMAQNSRVASRMAGG